MQECEILYRIILVLDMSDLTRFLLSRANIQISSEIRKAIKVYERGNISITDCLLVVYGGGKKIASFDKGLLKLEGVKSVW